MVATIRPYFEGTAATEIQTATHDVLGRVRTITQPDQGVESVVYDGLTTVRTNALDQDQTCRGIARRRVFLENGMWYVVTEGYGNNKVPFMNLANDFYGPITFKPVDRAMTDWISV